MESSTSLAPSPEKRQGHSIRDIARLSGLSRNTVRKVLRGEHALRVKATPQASQLDPFKEYLRERYETHGLSAVRSIDEIRPLGYAGSIATLRRYLRTLKTLDRTSGKVDGPIRDAARQAGAGRLGLPRPPAYAGTTVT